MKKRFVISANLMYNVGYNRRLQMSEFTKNPEELDIRTINLDDSFSFAAMDVEIVAVEDLMK